MTDRGYSARRVNDCRIDQVAEILAIGILRLAKHEAIELDTNAENSQNPGEPGLEVSGKTRLSVRVG